MKLVKVGSRENYLKTEPFKFKPISDLSKFGVLTSYVKGESEELENDYDKLLMVTEGNIQFKINNQKTKLTVGDMILISSGEKFQIDGGAGAKIIQFTNPHANAHANNNSDQLLKFACSRQSTREFSDKPVLKKDIYYILKIGMYAPSGANRQPWKFIVVHDAETKRNIRENAERVEERFYKKIQTTQLYEDLKTMGLSWKKPFLETAPYLICVFANPDQPYYKESLWLATGWMLLAAEELGLATLTYTPSELGFISEILKVGKPYSPELIIPVGYPLQTEPLQPRKDIHDVVSWI